MVSSNGKLESQTFSVKKLDHTVVLPAGKTSKGLYFLSNLDQIFPYPIEIVFAFKGDGKQTETSAKAIKEALAKTLVEYYPLAGCLTTSWDGKMMSRCTGEGVPFVEAVSDNDMEVLGDITIIDPVKLRKLVHFKEDVEDIIDIPPLTVQSLRLPWLMAQHSGRGSDTQTFTLLPTPLSLLCHGSAAAHSGNTSVLSPATLCLPPKPNYFLSNPVTSSAMAHGSWLNTTQKPYTATHTPLTPLPWLSSTQQWLTKFSPVWVIVCRLVFVVDFVKWPLGCDWTERERIGAIMVWL
ncbi:unnamed protein product [Ilex paraguariensis]|uniref:Uncharacterized protein n=1 Tax=Ilex paraguariensis TaxID=185542 RepID=A0ABC8SX97_9AQUA